MNVVVIESPYAGEVARNQKYVKRCILDSLRRGEAPFASHALYTQVLEDLIAEERFMGMNAGFAFIPKSDFSAVYEDYGISGGMKEGIRIATELGHYVEYRKIGENDL